MHQNLLSAQLRQAITASALRCLGTAVITTLALAVHATPLTYARALQLATERAPSARAQRAAVDSANSAVVAAAELPNPRLIAGIENVPADGGDRYSLTRDFMTMRRIGWMQEVPNRDKRAARSDAAGARAERERVGLDAALLVVRRETALAWFAHHYAQRRLDAHELLWRENRLLLDTIDARIAAGKALAIDVLAGRQENALLEDRHDELMRELAQAQAGLVRWVGAAAATRPAGEAPALEPDSAALRTAIERQPELATYAPLLRMTAAQMREVDAARKGDWSWEVSYAQRGAAFSNMVSVMFTFELPLANQRRVEPLVTARRHDLERLEAEREETRQRLREELERLLAAHEELTSRLQRLRSVTQPLGRERVQLATASYAAGRTDLVTVIAARREHADVQMRTIEVEAARAAVRARLAHLVVEETR